MPRTDVALLLMCRRQASSKCGINQISVHDLSYVIWVIRNLPEAKPLSSIDGHCMSIVTTTIICYSVDR